MDATILLGLNVETRPSRADGGRHSIPSLDRALLAGLSGLGAWAEGNVGNCCADVPKIWISQDLQSAECHNLNIARISLPLRRMSS